MSLASLWLHKSFKERHVCTFTNPRIVSMGKCFLLFIRHVSILACHNIMAMDFPSSRIPREDPFDETKRRFRLLTKKTWARHRFCIARSSLAFFEATQAKRSRPKAVGLPKAFVRCASLHLALTAFEILFKWSLKILCCVNVSLARPDQQRQRGDEDAKQ